MATEITQANIKTILSQKERGTKFFVQKETQRKNKKIRKNEKMERVLGERKRGKFSKKINHRKNIVCKEKGREKKKFCYFKRKESEKTTKEG